MIKVVYFSVSALFMLPVPLNAATYSTVHVFNGTDGSGPSSALLADAQGMLYGTTYGDGSGSYGTVFKFDPSTSALQLLHTFNGQSDGANPAGALTFSSRGLLWGTTVSGGANGHGTVYKLDVSTGTETVVYSFKGISSDQGGDGCLPNGPLVVDQKNYAYGTTGGCGSTTGNGTLFRVNQRTGEETVLHAFVGATDGDFPLSGLSVGADGALYGTTSDSGPAGFGCVFKYLPGTKTFSVLYSFGSAGLGVPYAAPVFGPDGLLYGTALQGPSKGTIRGPGGIFRIDPVSGAEADVYMFSGSPQQQPEASLALAPSGEFYGLTDGVGKKGRATAFSFDPSSKTQTLIYEFARSVEVSQPRGYPFFPASALTLGSDGSFYGVTQYGGQKARYGTIFKLTP